MPSAFFTAEVRAIGAGGVSLSLFRHGKLCGAVDVPLDGEAAAIAGYLGVTDDVTRSLARAHALNAALAAELAAIRRGGRVEAGVAPYNPESPPLRVGDDPTWIVRGDGQEHRGSRR